MFKAKNSYKLNELIFLQLIWTIERYLYKMIFDIIHWNLSEVYISCTNDFMQGMILFFLHYIVKIELH